MPFSGGGGRVSGISHILSACHRRTGFAGDVRMVGESWVLVSLGCSVGVNNETGMSGQLDWIPVITGEVD